MSYRIQYSIVRDFMDETKTNSFGMLVQESYQRYNQEGFMKSKSAPYKYSIVEHNKKKSNLELNEVFIERHEVQIEQTFITDSSKSVTPSPTILSNANDNDNEAIRDINNELRGRDQILLSKVNTLTYENTKLKDENTKLKETISSLESHVFTLKQQLNAT